MVITDGYVSRILKTSEEKKIINGFMNAFALEELLTPEEMLKKLKESGFTNTKVINKTNAVKPSVDHFYRLMTLLSPFISLLSLIPNRFLRTIKPNATALILGRKAMDMGIGTYYIHCAQKP